MEPATLVQSPQPATIAQIPPLQQWLKENPRSSINAYYSEFGAQATQSQAHRVSVPVQPVNSVYSGYNQYPDNQTFIYNNLYVPPRKSAVVAVLLTIFFGPVGLFYVSIWGALLLTFLDIIAILLVMPLGLSSLFGGMGLLTGLVWLALVHWPLSVAWALAACAKHNRRARELAIKPVHNIR